MIAVRHRIHDHLMLSFVIAIGLIALATIYLVRCMSG